MGEIVELEKSRVFLIENGGFYYQENISFGACGWIEDPSRASRFNLREYAEDEIAERRFLNLSKTEIVEVQITVMRV